MIFARVARAIPAVIARLVRDCALERAIQYSRVLELITAAAAYWVARSRRATTI